MIGTLRRAPWSPRLVFFSAILGMLLLLGGRMAWMSIALATTPLHPTLRAMWITGRSDDADRWLHIMYSVPSAGECLRTGVMILYRDDPMEGRLYHTLGPVMNGASLAGTVQEFTLLFHLPKGLPPGAWAYIYRTHYECPPNGMTRWNYTTTPKEIVIP